MEAAKLQKNMAVGQNLPTVAVGQNLPTVAVGAGYNYHNLLDCDLQNKLLEYRQAIGE